MQFASLTCICLLTLNLLSAQQIDKQLLLEPENVRSILFTAGKGDKISVEIRQINGGKLSDFSLGPYQKDAIINKSDIKNYSFDLISEERSIYQIDLGNSKKSTCKLNLTVMVHSRGNHIPELGYKIQRDTTYAYRTSQIRTFYKEEIRKVQQEKFYLNSRSNALVKGGKSRVILPVNLPEGTVAWYYTFTASRKQEEVESTIKTFNLAASLAGLTEKGKKLSKSLGELTPPPGANICDIYLLDEKNAKEFRKKKDFIPFSFGSRENFKSGLVEINKVGRNTLYLGLNNPNNVYGIHIGIDIVALVKTEEELVETINIPVIISYRKPYLKD